MKKLLALLLFSFPFILLGQSMNKKYEIIYDLIQDEYKVVSEYYKTIKNKNSILLERTFYDGNEYCVIAIPNNSAVTDTDIFIKYKSGNDYVKNDTQNTWAMVKFSPSYTRKMDIKVVNNTSTSSSSYWGFNIIVLYKVKKK